MAVFGEPAAEHVAGGDEREAGKGPVRAGQVGPQVSGEGDAAHQGQRGQHGEGRHGDGQQNRGDPELTSLAQGGRHNAGGHDDGKTAEMGAAHIEPF